MASRHHSLRLILLGLLLAGSLFAGLTPDPALAETEPNDSIAQANTIGIGYQNAERNAAITSASDLDFYKFDVQAGQAFVIETFDVSGASRGPGTRLRLINSTGTVLGTGEFGTGRADKRIVFRFTIAGTYFIEVTQANYTNWTGAYSLRVLPQYSQPGAAWDENDDFEPNDVRELATAITPGLGNAVTRIIPDNANLVSGAADVDYFRFDVQAGQTYVIETYNIAGANRGPGTRLRLLNSTGTELETGDFGTGRADKRIVFRFTIADTYFLEVTRANYTSWTGAYSLRVLPKYDQPGAAWNEADDYEPNDVPELANALAFGVENAVTRQIAPNNNLVSGDQDQDYYRFEVQPGQRIMLHTFNVQVTAGNVGTGLTLFNSTGTKVADSVAGQGNIHRQIAITLPAGGTYFALVTRQPYSSWTGSYSFRVCANSCLQRVYLPLLRKPR